MAMGHRDTWHMPSEYINAGVTIARILPTNQLLEELQKSSGCIVLVGMNGKSLQIGGATENAIEVVKKKLDRLLKYYVSHMAKSNKEDLKINLVIELVLRVRLAKSACPLRRQRGGLHG